MKRYRSALMAQLLALGIAACDDDGTVTEPPSTVNVAPPNVEVKVPPAPPSVAPLSAMITPPSSEVAIGGMVDFAVGTSGGSGDASWTCASSDVAVATVETTETGCRATAVAAGGATVTAAVSKGSESTNVAATLTVSTTADAFIIVTSVEGEMSTDESGLKGRVNVDVSVERGDQTFEKLSLNVDGTEVVSRDLGTAAATEDGEQSVHVFTLSFNSAGYEEHGDRVDVDYMNGEHSIQAMLKVAGRDDALVSNAVAVKFDNDDFLMASMSGLGEGAVNSSTGQMWHGGPDASVEISAMPVVYSSGGVSSVTLGMFCGHAAATDSEAPFVFEVDCSDGYNTTASGGDKPEFTVGGDAIDVRASAVYLDLEAPTAPTFSVNPNKREDGWVNASVDFLGKHGTSNKDGWLVYHDGNASGGVGGYTPQFRIAAAGSDKKVGGAIAAPALTQVPETALAALAGQSSKMNAYCVVVSAVDRLGNESKLPKADADCVAASAYTATSAGLLAGIDVQAPTIAFLPASPNVNGNIMRNFQVQVTDQGSGIRTMEESVVAEVTRRDAKETKKVDPLDSFVELSRWTTRGLPGTVGYYTFTGKTFDKAGNSSGEITRTAVHDDDDPISGVIVGTYDDKTGRYPVTVTVTDNLSIKRWWAEARFAAAGATLDLGNGLAIGNSGLFLPREGAVSVDAYNASVLTTSLMESHMVRTYRLLQPVTGSTTDLASIAVLATDHGGESASAVSGLSASGLTGFDLTPGEIGSSRITAADVAGVTDDDKKVFTSFTLTSPDSTVSSGGTVELHATASGRHFIMPVVAVADDASTPNIDETVAEVVGREGLRDNPISRVDFYAAVDRQVGSDGNEALKYIGSVSGSSAGPEDFDSDDDNTNDSRRYVYTLQMTAADFLAIVGGNRDYGAGTPNDSFAKGDGAIVAFAVKDNKGVALYSAPMEFLVEW